MSPKSLEKEAVRSFKEVLLEVGLDNLTALIIAQLWVEPKPLSMDELAKKTGYSLASISLKLKHLGAVHGVERLQKPGTRKIFLYMKKDPIGLFFTKMNSAFKLISSTIKQSIPRVIEEFKSRQLNENELDILTNMSMYLKRMEKLEKILRKVNKQLEKEENHVK